MTLEFQEFYQQMLAPLSKKYALKVHHFFDGDFGDLERIEIENATLIGTVDFWSKGWLDIHLVHLTETKEIINEFLSPEQNQKKAEILHTLIQILKDTN